MSLKWHPDKNNNSQESTERFQEISAVSFRSHLPLLPLCWTLGSQFSVLHFLSSTHPKAYSILNDPNERAWYDRHRESILRGKDAEEGEAGDTGVEIWSFFSTSCFKGFGNDENRSNSSSLPLVSPCFPSITSLQVC